MRDRSRIVSHHSSRDAARQTTARLRASRLEARRGHQPTQLVRVGEPKRPGRPRIGRARARPSSSADRRLPSSSRWRPRLPRRRAPTRPPGRRTRAISARARVRLGHEHDAEAAEHAVDARVRRESIAEASSTRNSTFSTPELGRAPPCGVDHLGRDVGREQTPVRPEPCSGDEARVSRPGGELEHRLAASWDRAARPAARRAGASLRERGRRRSQPAADAAPGLDLLVLGRRYVATACELRDDVRARTRRAPPPGRGSSGRC